LDRKCHGFEIKEDLNKLQRSLVFLGIYSRATLSKSTTIPPVLGLTVNVGPTHVEFKYRCLSKYSTEK